MADPARILEDALALSVDERARIAHELLHSLEQDDADAAAAWGDEIRARVDEIEAGTAELEDWRPCELASKPPAASDPGPISSSR
jgi:putative addiction module component (TIGR02574 family)